MAATTSTGATASSVPRRVFHVRELERLGISQSTAYRRSRADGPWTRLAPGIVLTAPGPPTTDELIQAALLHAGRSAVITGMHGARLHGLTSPPEDAPVHVLIPHSRRVQSYAAIKIERTTRLPQPVMHNGIPTAPLARAVIDAARTWQTRALTRDILIEATRRDENCDPRQLIEEINRGSRRGTGLPREVLRSMMQVRATRAELNAFELIKTTCLPTPCRDACLFDARGSYVGSPSAWFDDVGLAVEIDSLETYSRHSSDSATSRSNSKYLSSGIALLRIKRGRITKEPEAVVDEIRKAYFAAAWRNRPNVFACHRGPPCTTSSTK